MNSTQIVCPKCNAALRLPPDAKPGKKGRCPRCKELVLFSPTRETRSGVIGAGDQKAIPTLVLNPAEEGVTESDFAFLGVPERAGEIARFGSFRILAVLGRGGMGVVFRAEDTTLDRMVALKVMLPEVAVIPKAKERFLREAKLAAKVEHDHIVTIFQVGEINGVPFLAMPLLKGRSLEDLLEWESPLPVAEVVRIGREVAEGLQSAHGHKLIHRDIKPANVWLEGGKRRVKILDFGLARPMASDVAMTPSGAIMGTPTHMSPEQAGGADKVDHRTDLFSLGVMLYQMLTGKLPFQGANVYEVIASLITYDPPLIRSIRPGVPAGLEALVHRLMAKRADDRPGSAAEVVRMLGEVRETPPVEPEVAPRPPRRKVRTVLALLLAAAMCVIAVMATLPPKAGNATEPSKPADEVAKLPEAKRPPPVVPPQEKDEGVQPAFQPQPRWNLEGRNSVIGALNAKLRPTDWRAELRNSAIGAVDATRAIVPIVPPMPPMKAERPPLLTKDVSKAELMALRKAWATYLKMPEEYAEDLGNGVQLEMVLIVPGVFWMGSPEGEADRSKGEVQHEVTITRPFYMAKYEMTQEQYVAITGKANPSYFASTGDGKAKVEGLNTQRYPVEQVSWKDATDATVALTEMPEKKTPGRSYRLPTEAEWEYTCRGGRVSKTSLPFHFADAQGTLSTEANYDRTVPYGGGAKGTWLERPEAVDAEAYVANRFGVYHMHGNAWEWCSDWYGEYAEGAAKDPTGAASGSLRVIRGGGWGSGGESCRAALRNRFVPSNAYQDVGFRVVAEFKMPENE